METSKPIPVFNLKPKLKRFCEEYVIDLNGTAAAKRTGYSQKTAGEIAYENLKKPEIKEYIQYLIDQRSKSTEITAERVLNELAKIAFGSMSGFVKNGKLKSLKDLTPDQLSIINEIETTKTGKTKFKIYQKDNALTNLMRHLGLFEKDNSQVSKGIKVVIKKKS